MAEGLLRALKGEGHEAHSAGVAQHRWTRTQIAAMAEIGIDISGKRSKGIEKINGARFDIVITVCDSAKKACPFFPGARKQIHKELR
jgi:arsenate reductase